MNTYSEYVPIISGYAGAIGGECLVICCCDELDTLFECYEAAFTSMGAVAGVEIGIQYDMN